MSLSDENALLKMVIETQAARLHEQEATIQELRQMVAELRSLKVNLEENLEELRRQIFVSRARRHLTMKTFFRREENGYCQGTYQGT